MESGTPDWLTQHDAELRPSRDGQSWSVYIGGRLQYLLILVPASGKHACRVVQTVNDQRVDREGIFPTPEAALQGGLQDLRVALGW